MKARVIALYLPQFHPIPENNRWWGPGFTEWTNVAKAKPLFKGHVQPKIPADLGFYDLRLPEVRQQQADLAHEVGIEGFCYYHYWFGGKQLLERPFNEVLASGKPDFPFCLCWANHSWSNKTWNRKSNMQSNSMLIEQTYPGYDDDYNHFMNVLPAFRDKRYITIDGKPVFFLYNPWEHTRVKEWIVTWRKLAQENGLPGLHFVSMCDATLTFKLNPDGTKSRVLPNVESSQDLFQTVLDMGFDAVNCIGMRRGEMLSEGRMLNLCKTILRKAGLPIGQFFDYSRTVKGFFPPETKWENVYPTIVPQWDRSPRAATLDGIYVHATPKAFEEHINDALTYIEKKAPEHRIMVLKSWNEWGEGNYVEPDLEFGHGWLEAIKNTIQ
ncbi:glycoside hydrolase family 99-like domain-containing protein [Hallella sp.]|uniref:glycosyltransferase WbsX family protein n=1 Tax=Hallella sp. TaxID=2980186 RepID=UPI00284ED2B8|nr:glycoside hydrolase family 99-like domain-containing protein [Hallella sp.]MDR3843460.1 glycoside hydrolase family 99-like domain-containing protein [Hallella sp.]